MEGYFVQGKVSGQHILNNKECFGLEFSEAFFYISFANSLYVSAAIQAVRN